MNTVFRSSRERRLWMWTAAIVLAIFVSLGLARTLAATLRAQGLLSVTFVICFAMVITTAVVLGLRRRPRGLEIAVGIGVLAAYLLVFVRMAIPEERTHLIEYGILALFIHEALKERRDQGGRVPAPGWLAVLLAATIGVLDELVQAVLPNRVFDVRDIGFNCLAAGMAVGASCALSWARNQAGRSKKEQ